MSGWAEKEEFTPELFERGQKPVMVQSVFDGKVYPGYQGISEELVMLFREVRQLRADVARLTALIETMAATMAATGDGTQT